MDLYAEGAVERNVATLTPDLLETLALYCLRVMPPERRECLHYRFFHLRSEGFRHLVPRPDKDEALRSTLGSPAGRARHRTCLDSELQRILLDPAFRETLCAAVVEHDVAPEVRPVLHEQASVNRRAFRYSEALLACAHKARVCEAHAKACRPCSR